MQQIRLISYSVRGIKNLDEWVGLSFYKKTINKNFSVRGYNLKGIYGANGAGKSAIMSSVKMLKGIICNELHLNNSIVKNQLSSLINKRLGYLEIAVEFLLSLNKRYTLFCYKVRIDKDCNSNCFVIASESLTARNALSHNSGEVCVFNVENGIINSLDINDDYKDYLIDRTKNLLSNSSFASVFIKKIPRGEVSKGHVNSFDVNVIALYLLGANTSIYIESEDEHTGYYFDEIILNSNRSDALSEIGDLTDSLHSLQSLQPQELSAGPMPVSKDSLEDFRLEANRLCDFLYIFKPELRSISVDYREDKDYYLCRLVLNYEGYSVDAEFESTGIKKLIKLYSYIKEVVAGKIVFIDELDSNLHDVYFCALLEYLKDYGEGQLCFTTHNIGPMDVLRQNKKSIDFISADHKIHSWTSSGNYSPAKLYKNGMIEGSPFNVDSIDFIGAFHTGEED